MTKKSFLVLILAIAGIASVNAQMRIGGSGTPNHSAVLDLNPDDNVSVGNAILGLALPRVNLRNSSDAFPLLSHVKGMAVYNMATVSDVKPGVYINDGAKWLQQLDSNTPVSLVERDSIVGNEVVDATVGGGLVRSGSGTEISPYTLGIADSGITTGKIANQSVTYDKLSDSTISKLKDNFSFVMDYSDPLLEKRIIDLVHKNERDSIIGNEVVGATDSSLTRSGFGIASSPYTLAVSENGINTRHIENQSVTMDKLSNEVTDEIMKDRFDFESHRPMLEERIINLIHENEQDSIVGNEVVGATDGSLIRSGLGTALSPYTLSVAAGGIESKHLKDSTVTSSKIAGGAVTTEKIANESITMEKLSADVLNELQSNGLMPANAPNTILISDTNKGWTTQVVSNNPYEYKIEYPWVQSGHNNGWVDLGIGTSEAVTPGLYLATVRIDDGGNVDSNALLDYIILQTGSLSYTMARQSAIATRDMNFIAESCVIYIPAGSNNSIHLYAHLLWPSFDGEEMCIVYLQPLLKLN